MTEKYSLVEVPEGSTLAFKNPEGQTLSTEELLIEIANKLDEVESCCSP